MSAPSLSEAERRALAERMRDAVLELGAGLAAGEVAVAVIRAAAAVLRGCADRGNEAAILALGIRSFEAEIELVRAGHAPGPERRH